MPAVLRIGLGLAWFLTATLGLAVIQIVALRSGWISTWRAPRLWHRLILSVLRVRVHASGAPAASRPLLVVSNHISWLDIMVLGSTGDLRFIAKSEMSVWPGIGAVARLNRTVFVDREARRRSGEQAGEIATRLAAGDALVLFPEGTTGDGNGVLPFKSSLFGAARLAGTRSEGRPVLVQPAAISYTARHGIPLGRRERAAVAWIGDVDLVPHILSILRGGPIDVHVRFGEPVSVMPGDDRKRLAVRMEGEIRTMLSELQHGRPRPDAPAK
jgi:lyso-ornithine lipid O-acyltransferase